MYDFVESEFQTFVARVEGKRIDDTELKQHLVEEFQSLRQQVQAVSNSVSERITKLQVELQSHQITVEKSESKIYAKLDELTDWYINLENKLQEQSNKSNSDIRIKTENKEGKVLNQKKIHYECAYCNQNYQTKSIQGGHFLSYNFCSHSCKYEYEKRNC